MAESRKTPRPRANPGGQRRPERPGAGAYNNAYRMPWQTFSLSRLKSRIYRESLVKPQDIADVCRILKEEPSLSFKLLLCLAGVDYKEYIQIVYVLLSLEHEHKLLIKTDVLYDDLHLPTVTSVWRGADWYEREAHDLFGVVFDGHPNMAPLILYEGFEGYPGRKEHPFHDYQEF